MKRIVLRAICVLLAAVLLAMVLPAFFIHSRMDGHGDPENDWLIVLGTAVNGTEPSPTLKQRLDTAVVYLNDYPDSNCVVTGGYGDEQNLSEAQCMFNYLTAAGIDPDRIHMEDRAANTIDNLRNTIPLLDGNNEVTIISSDFHLYRAGLIARDLGLNAALVPAKTEPFSLLAPWFIREIVALWMYLFS